MSLASGMLFWRCQVAKIGCLGRGVDDSAIRFDTIFEAICLGSFRSGSFWVFCGCRLLQAQARKSIKRSSLQTMTRSGWRYEIFTSLMWVNSHLNDFCSMSSIFGLHFQLLLKTWFLGGTGKFKINRNDAAIWLQKQSSSNSFRKEVRKAILFHSCLYHAWWI